MKKIFYIFLGLLPWIISCKKLVEVATPQNQLTTDKVFADTISAQAAMVNVYALFDKTVDPNYNKYLSIYTDDLIYTGSSTFTVEFNQSKLSITNGTVSNIWKNNYFVIYSCNQIIEQLQQSSVIPASMTSSLIAEAKFLRAYSYFYLVNSFGQVPLILTTNVDQTAKAVRTGSITVYKQIVQDLQDAKNNLTATYIGSGKVRANKWAATALLARVNLYQQSWTDAEAQSTAVISSGLYTPLSSPSLVFQAESDESILQFWTQNGYIADGPNLISSSGVPQYSVSGNLLASFETGDLRKSSWLQSRTVSGKTYYYSYKYHNRVTNTTAPEYLTALRVAEQYLIRAEARAEQGNINGAVQDLNVIRQRAGLADLSSGLSQSACLDAVMQEWRVEFFVESGHRYLELKRTGRLNNLMSNYKSTWVSTAKLLPIPQSEISYDPFLTQNAGY